MGEPNRDDTFAEVAVGLGTLTPEQVAECREIARKMREMGLPPRPLEAIALDRGFLDRAQQQRVREEMARRGVFPRLGGFELKKKLGAGGMGTVFLARQVSLDRTVAVKILPPELARNAGYVRRFRREARLAAQLSHPNAVQVFDVAEEAGRHFIVMEYVDGPSVERELASGPMAEERALGIVRDVAGALAAAHERGIIHRDVKPANILLAADGTAKLSDLGIAKDLSGTGSVSLTGTGGVVGTPAYMSPEQCVGDVRLDPRTDIYSLGVTLYRMVCGREPFAGTTPLVVMRKHVDEPLPDPSALRPDISEATVRLIEAMTRKDPRRRLPSCRAVVERIEAILRGEPLPPVERGGGTDIVAAALEAVGDGSAAGAPAAEAAQRTEVRGKWRRVAAVALGLVGGLVLAGIVFRHKVSGTVPTDQEPVPRPAAGVSPSPKPGAVPVRAGVEDDKWFSGLSEVERQQLVENQRQLEERLKSLDSLKPWARDWHWAGMRAQTLEVASESRLPGHADAILEEPFLAHRPSELVRTVTVPPGNPILQMTTRAENDCYLAVCINGKRMWETRPNSQWRTYRLDLSSFAGRPVRIAIVHTAGGPQHLWNGEHLWWGEIRMANPAERPADLLALKEIPSRQVPRWYEGWTIRNNLASVENQNILRVSPLLDGRAYVFVTHPLSTDVPCTLSRRCRIPEKNPHLRIVARAVGDALLKVHMDGRQVYECVLGGIGWTTLRLDLFPWAGKTASIVLEHHAGGQAAWHSEHVYWADLQVGESKTQPPDLIRPEQPGTAPPTGPAVPPRKTVPEPGPPPAEPKPSPIPATDIEAFRRAVGEGDPRLALAITDVRLRSVALRDIAVAKKDVALLAYLDIPSLRDTGFHRIAVAAKDPLLSGFIENPFIRKSCREKTGEPPQGTFLRVTTTPVAGKIAVDGRYAGAGFCVLRVKPGRHRVAFGDVVHPELAKGEYRPPAARVVEAKPDEEVRVTGVYRLQSSTPTPGTAAPPAKGWIVFSWCPPGTDRADLWLLSPDGARRERIIQSPRCRDTQPMFSPDGRRIVFLRRDGPYNRNGIWVCNSDGSDERQVVRGRDGKEFFDSPVWVSNSSIYFTRFEVGGKPGREVCRLDLDAPRWRRVFLFKDAVGQAEGVITDVSPDRKRLVMVAQGGGWAPTLDVYTVALDGGGRQVVYEDARDDYRDCLALWRPKGGTLAWCHYFTPGANRDPEYFGVAFAERLGGRWRCRMQQERNAFIMPLAWSPDGAHLLCARIHRTPGKPGCTATLFLMDGRFKNVGTVCELDNWDWGQVGQWSRVADWAKPPSTGSGRRETPALRFNGGQGVILVKHSESLDFTGAFTAEAWLWFERHGGKVGLLSRDNPDIGPWDFLVQDGKLQAAVAPGNWLDTPPDSLVGPLPLRKWLHLAMVFDTREVRVYVNGKKVAAYEARLRLSINGNDLKIARHAFNGITFDGMIRMVRLTAAARYTCDFKPRWQYGRNGKDTILLIPCDEGRGDVLRDRSGKGNDGRLGGGEWVQVAPPD